MTESQPLSLYKYLDADAATAVLGQSRLRWSAPCAFDDPFELDAGAELSFDPALLERTASKAIAAAVFSRQPPAGLPGHPMTSVIRRWRAQHRFTCEDEVHEALQLVLPAMVERRQEELATIMQDWRAFATRVRILCLSERHNDIAQWQRHADRHRGVALKLAVGDGGNFAAPQPVSYQPRRPQITTLGEQVSVLLGQARHVAQDYFRERLLGKVRSDAEEREWRCFRNLDADDTATVADTATHVDLPFRPEELQAVYLGARTPQATRDQLLAILAERYPATRVLQAALSSREFSVEFQPLDGEPRDEPVPAEHAADTAPGVAARSA